MLSYRKMYEINMIMYIHDWKLTRILIGCIKFELFCSLQVLMNVICTPSRLNLVVWVSRMLTASLRLNLLGLPDCTLNGGGNTCSPEASGHIFWPLIGSKPNFSCVVIKFYTLKTYQQDQLDPSLNNEL